MSQTDQSVCLIFLKLLRFADEGRKLASLWFSYIDAHARHPAGRVRKMSENLACDAATRSSHLVLMHESAIL